MNVSCLFFRLILVGAVSACLTLSGTSALATHSPEVAPALRHLKLVKAAILYRRADAKGTVVGLNRGARHGLRVGAVGRAGRYRVKVVNVFGARSKALVYAPYGKVTGVKVVTLPVRDSGVRSVRALTTSPSRARSHGSARVLSMRTHGAKSIIVLNKGTRQGLRRGQLGRMGRFPLRIIVATSVRSTAIVHAPLRKISGISTVHIRR